MRTMIVRTIGAVFFVALTLVPLLSHAQFSYLFKREIILTLAPENPVPGETVRLAISSYSLDLDRSIITWKANGVVFAHGVGLKETSIAAGEVGSTTDITVDVLSDSGEGGFAEARITPSELQLLWTTDGYTPPFFKGRKHAGTNATVRAYALTDFTRDGERVPEKDIVYTWYRNGTVIADASGRGKSHATLRGPALGTETLRVVAETADRTQRAEASVPIIAHDARLVLYENHPLFGILYHRAIVGDVNTIERELKVTAVPYFAHTDKPQTLSYEWAVHEHTIEPNEEAPETLTLVADEYVGPVEIKLVATNPADILMRSTGAWRIVFGGTGGIFTQSLFGE